MPLQRKSKARFNFARRFFEHMFMENGTTARAVAMGTPTITSSPGISASVEADGPWHQMSTTTAADNVCSLVYTTPFTAAGWLPDVTVLVKTTTSDLTANTRLWLGFFSATPATSDTPNVSAVAVRYSTSASDAGWKIYSCDGAGNFTVVSTTATIAQSTVYAVRFRFITATECEVSINGVIIGTASATMPASTTLLGVNLYLNTLSSGVAKTIKYGHLSGTHT